jgi:glucosyl-dolichyl phosphate glucuronosyltransferase
MLSEKTAHQEVIMPNISVVICAYTEKRWRDLIAAVESVKQQSLPPREIIVVIDHNPSLAKLARSTFVGEVVLENNNPRGLSGARNCGIEVSTGEVVAFLDDDAVASRDWLQTLVSHYQDPRVIGVGGKIEPMYLTGQPAWFPEEFGWVVGCSYRGLPETVAAVRNLIGCNMSFRREVLELCGGFQTGMGRIGAHPVGDEETEFCIRSSQQIRGGILLYDPTARVRHSVPPERASWRYLFRRCYSEGLSKAQLSRLVGGRDGLASEWQYTLKTLPNGVSRGFIDFVVRRDLGGLGRAFAIMAGFGATVSGYLVAKAAGPSFAR